MKPISRIQCLGFPFWWCIYIRFKCIWCDIQYGSLPPSLPHHLSIYLFLSVLIHLIHSFSSSTGIRFWFSAVEIFAFLFSHLMSPFGDDEMMKNLPFFSLVFIVLCALLFYIPHHSLSRIIFIVLWIHWNHLPRCSLSEPPHQTHHRHSDRHWW